MLIHIKDLGEPVEFHAFIARPRVDREATIEEENSDLQAYIAGKVVSTCAAMKVHVLVSRCFDRGPRDGI